MLRLNLRWRGRCRRWAIKKQAKEHFKLFQHMTSTKISAAIGLAYGEQGHYSTVTPVEEPQARQKTMIPVKLVAEALGSQVSKARPGAPGSSETGGACMLDVTGSGQMDLVLMESGKQAIRVLHRGSDGKFADVDVAAAGAEGFGRCRGLRGGRL